MKYKRILLKLSGEALIGNKNFGIDSNKLENYSNEITVDCNENDIVIRRSKSKLLTIKTLNLVQVFKRWHI